MNTATKVGEIFSKAGDQYNKIGDMIIMLAPAAHELIAIDEKNAIYYDQQQQQTVQLVSGNAVSSQPQSAGQQQVITLTPEQYAQLAQQQQQAGTNVKYELATAQVPQGQQQQNVKYVLANQSGAGQAANVVNVVTSSPNQQIINGISLPQQPLPLVQHQQQYVHQQHPSTSKTTIIKHEVPNNTPLPVQQIQTPDVSALLEAAVCQQEAQHQAAAQGTLVTTEAPAVANEEEISNIVQTS